MELNKHASLDFLGNFSSYLRMKAMTLTLVYIPGPKNQVHKIGRSDHEPCSKPESCPGLSVWACLFVNELHYHWLTMSFLELRKFQLKNSNEQEGLCWALV